MSDHDSHTDVQDEAGNSPVPETLEAAPEAEAQEAPLSGEALDRLNATQEIINQWMRDRIYGSPIAQNTPAFNHLRQALPELARNLVKGQ